MPLWQSAQDAACPCGRVPWTRHTPSGKCPGRGIAPLKKAPDAASISRNMPPAACRHAIADPVSPVFSRCRQHARHLGRGAEMRFGAEKLPLECRMQFDGLEELPRVCKGNSTPGHEDRGREVSDRW